MRKLLQVVIGTLKFRCSFINQRFQFLSKFFLVMNISKSTNPFYDPPFLIPNRFALDKMPPIGSFSVFQSYFSAIQYPGCLAPIPGCRDSLHVSWMNDLLPCLPVSGLDASIFFPS